MITLCKNTLHTFLGLSSSPNRHHQRPTPSSSPPTGGLILISGDFRKPPHVLESSALKPSPPLNKHPGGLGNNGRGGAVVHGLSSCTESLGFESSDQMEEMTADFALGSKSSEKKRSRERLRWREEVRNRKLPPPLSSLNQNGQSTFFLRPVRENGRLVLTEVKISRPEIFRASRQDGRLRLEIAGAGSGTESAIESEQEPDPEPVKVEGTAVSNEKEKNGRRWKIPVTGGEGFRRCHEMRSHHHHNHLTLWNHQCVTTR